MLLHQALLMLYKATIDLTKPQSITLPKELKTYAQTIYKRLKIKHLPNFKGNLTPHIYTKDEDLTIFLFTGGKDSLASYLKYKHLTKKHKLFFVKGLNTLYPLEYTTLEEMEKRLQQKIDVITFKSPRLKGQTESSVKNLLIHTLAIEHYKVIPKYFSFGFIQEHKEEREDLQEIYQGSLSQEEIDILEEVDKEDEKDYKLAKILGELPKQGSSQVSLVAGDSSEVMVYGLNLLSKYYNTKHTKGVESLIETFRLVRSVNLQTNLSSCMSLTAFRAYNKQRTQDKHSLTLEGLKIIAGTILTLQNKTLKKTSVYNYTKQKIYNYTTKQFENTKPTLHHLKNVDIIGVYECSVCDKCCERYLVQHAHFQVKYSETFLNSRYRLLLQKLKKMGNNNNIDYSHWLVEELGLNKSRAKKLIQTKEVSKALINHFHLT